MIFYSPNKLSKVRVNVQNKNWKQGKFTYTRVLVASAYTIQSFILLPVEIEKKETSVTQSTTTTKKEISEIDDQ